MRFSCKLCTVSLSTYLYFWPVPYRTPSVYHRRLYDLHTLFCRFWLFFPFIFLIYCAHTGRRDTQGGQGRRPGLPPYIRLACPCIYLSSF